MLRPCSPLQNHGDSVFTESLIEPKQGCALGGSKVWWKVHEFQNQTDLDAIHGLPLISCVILGNFFNVSEFQCPSPLDILCDN